MASNKIHSYVKLTLNKLHDLGWEVEEVIEVSDWWAQNVWKLSSNRQSFGMKLYITPLTDRQSNTRNGDYIEAIRASGEMPVGFYNDTSVIAECYTNGRKFEDKLEIFISEIQRYRNTF